MRTCGQQPCQVRHLLGANLQAHRAVQAALGGGHKCVDSLLQRREPLAVVHAASPRLLKVKLVVQHFALEHQIFQRFVCKNQCHGGRRLIALTAFHAHQAVFNHVDAAIAVLAGNSVQFVNNAQIAFLVAVDGIGNATGKRQLNVLPGSSGAFVGSVVMV